MNRYAAFLRGVNVGGINLKMAAVADALENAGFNNVKTILASGNVLLESRSGADSVRNNAEKALRDEFGYDAWVLAYDLDTVPSISDGLSHSNAKSTAIIPTSPSSPTPTCSTIWPTWPSDAGPDEKIKRGKGVIYWQVPHRRHPGHHHRQDDGQEALQVLDHHAQPAHDRQGSARLSGRRMHDATSSADLTGVSETALMTLQVARQRSATARFHHR